MKCPCDSNLTYANCCEPFVEEKTFPVTAEQLMRSRYTAYTKAMLPYLKKTMALESQHEFDADGARKWATESTWLGLKIHSTEAGQAKDDKGIVDFTATFEQNGTKYEHRERSLFRKDRNAHWRFCECRRIARGIARSAGPTKCKGGTQRRMPLWKRKEIQKVLRGRRGLIHESFDRKTTDCPKLKCRPARMPARRRILKTL